MFMLCHYIKDDKKICNAPAMRGAHYCRHHLELINRKMRMARKRRQLLESFARNNPLNSRQAVLKAKQRISEGIGGLGKEETQVLASGFRLLDELVRVPESARNRQLAAEAAPGASRNGDISPCG